MANTRDLLLKIRLFATDKVSGALKYVQGNSKATTKEVKDLRDKLKSLEKVQGNIEAFRNVSRSAGIISNRLQEARAKVAELQKNMAAATTPTKAMTREFEQAQEAAKRLKSEHGQLIQKQQQLRTTLAAAGISTKSLSTHQKELKTNTAQAAAALSQEEAKLKAVNAQMQKMHAARAKYDKIMGIRNQAAGAGATLGATGAAIGAPVFYAIKQYSSFEDAMLGVARQVEGARDSQGKLTSIYYEMGDAIKIMATRIPMATTEIAALVEAGARMGIQGKENLLTFAETTAITAAAFDLPVDLIGDQMGKLSNLYKVPIKSISQLGDTINWLDDNALSKGGDIIDVMQRIAGTAATVNMNFKDAAALGSTFLSLGASPEIAATASNAMMRELAIAAQQPKRFQAGLSALGMSSQAIQNGMSKDATGTILKVLDAINKLPDSKQLGITTELFGKQYGDDAAKLAKNIGEYRRQLDLVNQAEARGSMVRESSAKNDAISSRLQMLQNRVFNGFATTGELLRPAMVELMSGLAGWLDWFNRVAQENPKLIGFMLKAAAMAAILVTALGAIALGMAAIFGPFAMAKFALTTLGISLGGTIGLLGRLGGAFNILMRGIGLVGNVLIWLGRALLMNPIGLAITAIATAAFLIYKYWSPIKTFFTGLWDGISAFFSTLPARFMAMGSQIMQGLVNGITSGLSAVKNAITGAGESAIGWFKEKLGIHSPSRVFAELGGFTMAGFDQGLNNGQGGILSTIAGISRKLAGAGAGLAFATAAPFAAALSVDSRPPIAASAPGAAGGSQIVINIYPAAGANPTDIAKQVAAELDRRERQNAATKRSSLKDWS